MGDPYGAIKFGEFRKYMQNKQSKLKEQEAALIDPEDSKLPSILQGLSIHINGYTDPPQSELRKLIVALGGDYQHYLRKSKVTHIIATTLTNSKMEEFRAYKVVTPDWIIDSKKAGRLLPWNQYRLVRNQNRQTELVFNNNNDNKINSKDNISITSMSSPTTYQSTAAPALNDNINSNNNSNSSTITKNKQKQCITQTNNHLTNSYYHKKSTTYIDDIPQNIHQINSNNKSTNVNNKLTTSNNKSININDKSTNTHNKSTSSSIVYQQKVGNSSINKDTALFLSTWDRDHTSMNPDFVKSYYKSSRLHYLSAMREELKDIVRRAKQQRRQQHSLSLNEDDDNDDRKQNLQLYIMHIDFDCFFTAVGIKDRPELKNQPVAVAHGKGMKENSSSDIASCNYIARSFGIYNGMIVGKAKKLCPNLKIIPYEFEKYKQVSEAFYNVLFQFTNDIQAVSVDEALLEIWASNSQGDDNEIEALANTLRNNIREKTGCEASIGIGSNILLAKLATKKAKPCGQYYCKPEQVNEFLSNQKVTNLPRVGHSMSSKLKNLHVNTVGDLRKISLTTLTTNFGPRTGQLFYNYARGIDDRKLVKHQQRKSVSAEITWAIRFEKKDQVYEFLKSLSTEVSDRLRNINKKGKSITLKVLIRSSNAPKEIKYLGSGECDSHSKSILLDKYIDDADTIALHVTCLFDSLNLIITNIRGIGIHIQKLNNDEEDINNESSEKKLYFHPIGSSRKKETTMVNHTPFKENMTVDYNVFMELPQGIRQELKDKYELLLMNQPTNDQPTTSYTHQPSVSGANDQINDRIVNNIDSDHNENNADLPSFIHNSPSTLMTQSFPDLPSWSQLDPEVLLALPENMQRQILETYKKIGKKESGNKKATIMAKNTVPKLPSSTPIRNDHSKIRKPQPNPIKGKQKEKINNNARTLTQLYVSAHQEEDEDIIADFNENNIESNHRHQHQHQHHENMHYEEIDQLDIDHPIDMEVWSELPKDIQQELLNDYNKYRQNAVNQANLISKNNKMIQEPKLMGKTELNEVRELITTWIENYFEVPHENDVITIKTYLLDLVQCKELEKVHLLLLHLINISKKKGGSEWNSIVENIQQSVSNAIENDYHTSLYLK